MLLGSKVWEIGRQLEDRCSTAMSLQQLLHYAVTPPLPAPPPQIIERHLWSLYPPEELDEDEQELRDTRVRGRTGVEGCWCVLCVYVVLGRGDMWGHMCRHSCRCHTAGVCCDTLLLHHTPPVC